jgi:hypothetical protein
VSKALHSLVEQRLPRASERRTSGRREVVEVLGHAGPPASVEGLAELAVLPDDG